MHFHEQQTVDGFLELAGGVLTARESENSLLLGLAWRLRNNPLDSDTGARLFTITEGERVIGAILKSPGRSPVFSDMPPAAAELATAELFRRLEAFPGCIGPNEVVDVIASKWSTLSSRSTSILFNMRLFELETLLPPRPAAGRLRLAQDADRDLAYHWSQAFMLEVGLHGASPDKPPERVEAFERRSMYLWEVDGEAVAMAAWSRPLEEGISIGGVYTPHSLRGHGYASNLVANLTSGLLDGSLYQPARRRVNLFTDLSNPTSNGIYTAMGYRPVRDFRHYAFEE